LKSWGNAVGDTPGVFAKSGEVIGRKGDALRSFAGKCRKRAKEWGTGKAEGDDGRRSQQRIDHDGCCRQVILAIIYTRGCGKAAKEVRGGTKGALGVGMAVAGPSRLRAS
jgi:hypothetical protein